MSKRATLHHNHVQHESGKYTSHWPITRSPRCQSLSLPTRACQSQRFLVTPVSDTPYTYWRCCSCMEVHGIQPGVACRLPDCNALANKNILIEVCSRIHVQSVDMGHCSETHIGHTAKLCLPVLTCYVGCQTTLVTGGALHPIPLSEDATTGSRWHCDGFSVCKLEASLWLCPC